MSKELFEHVKELDGLTKSDGEIPELAMVLADKEQIYKWMMERKKSHLARIIENSLLENKVAFSRAEIRALASKDYLEFMSALRQAMSEYYNVKYKYESLINRCDVLRTFISLEKEKMNLR